MLFQRKIWEKKKKPLRLGFLIDEIFFIKEQISKIEEEIKAKSKGIKKIELVQTIPGVGTVSAASIVGEIASIGRFSSVKKLRAFAGIDPSIKESGSSVRGRSILSKRGSPYLRRALYYAANAARRFSPTFKEYYERKNSQHPKSNGRYAIVATANKLLTVIYYMLKHKEPFNPMYQWKGRSDSNSSKSKSINMNTNSPDDTNDTDRDSVDNSSSMNRLSTKVSAVANANSTNRITHMSERRISNGYIIH